MYIELFHTVHMAALSKFSKHWDVHPCRAIYKAARVFDPRQARSLLRNQQLYSAVGLEVTPDSADEWFAYQLFARNATNDDLNIDEDGHQDLKAFWSDGAGQRFPLMQRAADIYMWFPVRSVDVERSFSSYKTLVTNKRQSLTHEHTNQLVAMYFNGDIEGRWEGFTL